MPLLQVPQCQGDASGKQDRSQLPHLARASPLANKVYSGLSRSGAFHKHDCTGEETTRFLEFRASGGCMGINYI